MACLKGISMDKHQYQKNNDLVGRIEQVSATDSAVKFSPCGKVQAITPAAPGLTCFIFRFLRRPQCALQVGIRFC
jgi:hypothetical protein